MLQTIRDKISGWVAIIFLGIIAIVFIFWGVDFQSNSGNFAAKVDGTAIPSEKVRRAWQQRQSQLQQMMRSELPADMVKAQQTALLDQFVRNSLLTQRAEEYGYRVSDQALAQRILEIPELQVEGKFDRDRYAILLRQQGRTEPQFESELRADMAIGQIQDGIVASAFVVAACGCACPCRFLWVAVRVSPSIRFRSATNTRTTSSMFSLKNTLPRPISRRAVTAGLLWHSTRRDAPAASWRARSAARMHRAKWLFTRSRQSSTVTRAT